MKNTDLEGLMSILVSKPELSLRFYLGDVSINHGYHVTEVKYANVKSMDCGKNNDAWDELLIQLLDGEPNSIEGLMSTSKFTRIVSAAIKALPDESAPYLFFEFAPNNAPLLKLRIQDIACNHKELSVHLTHEVAACKPFQKWGRAGSILEKVSTKVAKADCCSGNAACCC